MTGFVQMGHILHPFMIHTYLLSPPRMGLYIMLPPENRDRRCGLAIAMVSKNP